MSTNLAIGRAVRCALAGRSSGATPLNRALLIVAATLGAQTALAQATPAANTEEVDTQESTELKEVVVVGSRLRRDTFNSPSPIQVVTREETTLAGFNSTADILQGTSVTTGAAQINNAFGGFVTDGGPGANTLSLRGLGAGRTLVLINGRRIAPAGTRGAVGSADLNVLPNAIIERVDILRDGASSIYGSDAIAGVVNVVTLSNPEGITFEAHYNRPTEGEGEQGRFSIVAGTSGEGWSVSGSVDYYQRADLTLADREWTRCNTDSRRNPATGASTDFVDPLTGQPKCYPITSTGSNGVTINTIGTNTVAGVGAPGSVTATFNRWRPNSAVTTGVVGFEGVGGGTNNINVRDTFDPRTLNRSLVSPATIVTGFLQSTVELSAESDMELYFELLANERRSEQTGYRQLSLDYRVGSPLIPTNLAFSVFGPDQGTSGGVNVGVRAFIGFGNDTNEQTVEYYKPTIGIRGDLPFLDNWRYDVALAHSRSDAEYRQQSFLTDKVTFAGNVVAAPVGTDPSLVRNGLTCSINITNPEERCIPYPRLNNQTIAGQLPSDFSSYIFRDVVGTTRYDETLATATVDGDLIDLPAGPLKALLGLEYRRAEIDDTPDPNSVAGNLYNLTSATPTRGEDNVFEAYTEVDVPILADLPGINELTFGGSLRYTEYDSYGSDETYKLGLTYSPVKWVSLRYSNGTSFRAPALFEQYQGATSGFLAQTGDPCNNYGAPGVNPARAANCATELPGQPAFQATSSIRVLSEGGAAAGLEAETSDNVTFGIIVQPPLGEFGELSIAVDYFDIEINNGVDQAGAANILALCYDDPQFRAGGGFCRLTTRNPATAALTVSNAYTNIATQISRGVDFTLRFETDAGPGTFRLNAEATHYQSQANKLFVDDPLDEFNGTINTPEWTGNATLTYFWDKWRFRYGVEWIDSMDSYGLLELDRNTSTFDFEVDEYFEHSASLRYTNEGWQATAGMRNIFNNEPPVISSGFYNRVGNAPLYSGYDYVGREVFLEIAKQFK